MAYVILRNKNEDLKWETDYKSQETFYASNFTIYSNYEVIEEENDFGRRDSFIQGIPSKDTRLYT
jgi:hypothetical protein